MAVGEMTVLKAPPRISDDSRTANGSCWVASPVAERERPGPEAAGGSRR
jgi:hypothetical protein